MARSVDPKNPRFFHGSTARTDPAHGPPDGRVAAQGPEVYESLNNRRLYCLKKYKVSVGGEQERGGLGCWLLWKRACPFFHLIGT